jgi:hypothetical protein
MVRGWFTGVSLAWGKLTSFVTKGPTKQLAGLIVDGDYA